VVRQQLRAEASKPEGRHTPALQKGGRRGCGHVVGIFFGKMGPFNG
jgi:hypothetical protein